MSKLGDARIKLKDAEEAIWRAVRQLQTNDPCRDWLAAIGLRLHFAFWDFAEAKTPYDLFKHSSYTIVLHAHEDVDKIAEYVGGMALVTVQQAQEKLKDIVEKLSNTDEKSWRRKHPEEFT